MGIIRPSATFAAAVLYAVSFAMLLPGAQSYAQVPSHIPPRRASQLQEAPAGVNTSLPRMPYLPWTEPWWTRIYDAGIKYVRIGQYEDTSDITGWDWTEQKKGQLQVAPHVDEYIDSLKANGATIELQLLYGNPIYTSPAGMLPAAMEPSPSTFHNPDFSLYSIFWPPVTPDQTAAFLRYTQFMVSHFQGRVPYYALWNEEDGSYWNPRPDPEHFGRLMAGFTKVVRETDRDARVLYGGQASFDQAFARATLKACECAGDLSVFAYHTYPGGFVLPAVPESIVSAAAALREAVLAYPGIGPGIQFWQDEYNSVPSRGPEMNDAIQAKYVSRMIVGNWAVGVPTFVWELINDTSTNEGDDFGIIHGMMHKPSDFQARPVFSAMQRVNALLGDTRSDATVQMKVLDSASFPTARPFTSFGFRSRSGKSMVTYWLAVKSLPDQPQPAVSVDVSLSGASIEHPVLIDVDADRITEMHWEGSGADRHLRIPVKDSVMAIADASYIDWPVLPAAPAGLHLSSVGGSSKLHWQPGDAYTTGFIVERRSGASGRWSEIARLSAQSIAYEDSKSAKDFYYRVRSAGAAGQSGYSNVVGGDLP